MACNRPTDGTPFGGYSGWLYFRCPPYDEESSSRKEQAMKTASELIHLLKSHQIESELLLEDTSANTNTTVDSFRQMNSAKELRAGRSLKQLGLELQLLTCNSCGKTWQNLAQFLRDPGVRLYRYRACVEDFNKGAYEFSHSCGSPVGVPAARFVRSRAYGKSLAGSHACPGLCYYENSLLGCSAVCEC
jgi:hypothetical protein